MNTTTRHCPRCGAGIPAHAPQGLCPKCLMAEASATTVPGADTGSRGDPPSIETVQAAFPNLEIVELIGQGGMGFVYKARQPRLDRYVALKILPESLSRDPAFAERFSREGRLLARLNHPNIVSVYDFGQANGFFHLIMEYVDGVNLRQAMRASRFTPKQAFMLVPHICAALQYAHDEGVLHRDIKPENLLLDTKGRIKIADFGIAKLAGDAKGGTGLTASGAALGTPHYMAPEQIEQPGDVDHRADIYSLGVVFYEMLTGELPLGRFAPPSSKTPVSANVDEIVLRALAKERALRQQSAGEMKTQVETAAGGTLVSIPAAQPAHTSNRSPQPSSIPRIHPLLALAALSGGAWFIAWLFAFGGRPVPIAVPQALIVGVSVFVFVLAAGAVFTVATHCSNTIRTRTETLPNWIKAFAWIFVGVGAIGLLQTAYGIIAPPPLTTNVVVHGHSLLSLAGAALLFIERAWRRWALALISIQLIVIALGYALAAFLVRSSGPGVDLPFVGGNPVLEYLWSAVTLCLMVCAVWLLMHPMVKSLASATADARAGASERKPWLKPVFWLITAFVVVLMILFAPLLTWLAYRSVERSRHPMQASELAPVFNEPHSPAGFVMFHPVQQPAAFLDSARDFVVKQGWQLIGERVEMGRATLEARDGHGKRVIFEDTLQPDGSMSRLTISAEDGAQMTSGQIGSQLRADFPVPRRTRDAVGSP